MSTKWLWGLLIAMAVALLGLVSIQAYWINYSVTLNQAKFDQAVRSALSNIVQGIERESRQSLHTIERGDVKLLGQNGLSKEFRIKQLMNEVKDVQALLGIIDINELIDARYIDRLVKVELENRGIELDYHYGIYSTRNKAFVIIDGHNQYIPPADSKSSDVNMKIKSQDALFNAYYQADIFPSIYGSQAVFKLHFPDRTSVGWNESWWLLLGSVVFILLILLVFAYTLFTILRQKKLSEMKNDFINNMTHEFKTPIATISLATDSLSSERIREKPELMSKFINVIKQENARMLKQVEKVLQIALVDKHNFSLSLSEVDIHSIIQQAIKNQGMKVRRRGGKLSIDLQASPSVVEGDETHLSNIIHNLLENAEKYSPDAPQIEIKTWCDKDSIHISISDKGVGMTKDEQKHIFDKFYRVHSGNIHDVKGFGLGLSYVKAVITAHQGEISVQSKKGQGTSFHISLPYEQE